MGNEKQAQEEGPRSFAHFFQSLDGGEANVCASVDLHKLSSALRDEAKRRRSAVKGTLTLTLELKCDEAGTVEANYTTKIKEPVRKSSKSIFWLTKGGNLTPENPRQQNLPLREVQGGSGEVRDVGDHGAVREV